MDVDVVDVPLFSPARPSMMLRGTTYIIKVLGVTVVESRGLQREILSC